MQRAHLPHAFTQLPSQLKNGADKCRRNLSVLFNARDTIADVANYYAFIILVYSYVLHIVTTTCKATYNILINTYRVYIDVYRKVT